MKLALPETPVETSAVFKDVKFGFGDHAVIMEILRGKMYSNPIKTLCQEIMSNARDAHIEVGKSTTPIEVTLPTSLDMSIKFRDFGPGISPDRMAQVFVLYGSSTKRSDNDQVGGWGLGAKSPFAYSDTFSVVSITPDANGQLMRREYIAYIDSTRIGVMSMVKEEPTTENQGTTVIVPVKSDDVRSFTEAVRETGTFWEVKPVVKPVASWSWNEPSYTYVSPSGKWALIAGSLNGYRSDSSRIVIAGIQYPLDIHRITSKVPSKALDTITRGSLVLRFNTGELPITANREAVDLDANAITKIAGRLVEAHDELKRWIERQLNQATTYPEALVLFRNFSQFGIQPSWGGHKIRNEAMYLQNLARVTRYDRDPAAANGFSRKEIDRWNRGAYFHLELKEILDPTVAVIESDGYSLGHIAGVFTALPDIKTMIMVQFTDHGAKSKDSLNWDLFGFKKLSSFPKVKLCFTPPTGTKKIPPLKEMKASGWVTSNLDPVNGSGHYVILTGGRPMWLGRPSDNPTLTRIAQTLNVSIIGVFAHRVKQLGPNWRPLEELANKQLTELLKKFDPTQIIESDHPRNYVDGNAFDLYKALCKKLPSDHKLNLWLTASSRSAAAEELRQKLNTMHSILERSIPNWSIHKTDWYDTVHKMYPLLFHVLAGINWRTSYEMVRDPLYEYVTFRDSLLNASTTTTPTTPATV